MIERAYICFQGPEKAGKTTLILKLLESSRKIHWLVCRIIETNSPELIGTWTESEETFLFKEAGALKSHLYYASNNRSGLDDPFWYSSFINYFSNAIAFEGNCMAWGKMIQTSCNNSSIDFFSFRISAACFIPLISFCLSSMSNAAFFS